jgi:hypothetical protein
MPPRHKGEILATTHIFDVAHPDPQEGISWGVGNHGSVSLDRDWVARTMKLGI